MGWGREEGKVRLGFIMEMFVMGVKFDFYRIVERDVDVF